jgi:hypothetical protein
LRAALRRAERDSPSDGLLRLPPRAHALALDRPNWIDTLARRTGRSIVPTPLQ